MKSTMSRRSDISDWVAERRFARCRPMSRMLCGLSLLIACTRAFATATVLTATCNHGADLCATGVQAFKLRNQLYDVTFFEDFNAHYTVPSDYPLFFGNAPLAGQAAHGLASELKHAGVTGFNAGTSAVFFAIADAEWDGGMGWGASISYFGYGEDPNKGKFPLVADYQLYYRDHALHALFIPAAVVPEPATLALVSAGLLVVAARRRSRPAF